jgi:uncharacterized protein YacL
MDENLRITLIGLLTLIIGTIFVSIIASFGYTQILAGLAAFVVAAIIVVSGFHFGDRHYRHMTPRH